MMRCLGGLGASRGSSPGKGVGGRAQPTACVWVCVHVCVCVWGSRAWAGEGRGQTLSRLYSPAPPPPPCLDWVGWGGSWGPLPHSSGERTSLGNLYGRGPHKHWHVGPPLKSDCVCGYPLQHPTPPCCRSTHTSSTPSLPNVMLRAWEELQVHGQTAY